MNRSRAEALVFDLDGTLWDAAAATAEAWNQALNTLGVPCRVTVDGVRSVSGTPFLRCVETLLPGLCPPGERLLRSLDDAERRAIEHVGGMLYEGVAEGLGALASEYQLFLVSNCQEWYLDAFLRISGLRGCFAGWDCHGASGIAKPGMLRDLVLRYRLEHAVYIGDTQGDRDAAEAAGMGFALARYGFGTVDDASPVFESFTDLVEYFLL